MNIPGFYFDKQKNRYFKVTNGALTQNSTYHNNEVEREKRQLKYQQEKEQIKMTKGIANQSLKYKLIYKNHTGLNSRLGLIRLNPSLLEYQRLCHLRMKKFIHYNGQECKIWDKFKYKDDIYLIVTNQVRNFMSINVSKVLSNQSQIIPSEEVIFKFEDYSHLNEIINKLNLLPFEYLTISTFKNLTFCNCISESDLDNPQIYQNFIMLEMIEKHHDKYFKVNKCHMVYDFLHSLPNGEIKKDLNHLFGMNIINYSPEISEINYNINNLKPCKRFFITFSRFTDDYLILGTNLGIIYLIKFKLVDGDVKFFQEDIIKFKFDKIIKLDKINKIIKLHNYLIITSFKTLLVINLLTHEKFFHQLHEIIINLNCFKLINENFLKLIIISYKKIVIVQFQNEGPNNERFLITKKFDIFNNNSVNQFSLISNNNLILNQNNNELLIINLINHSTDTIDLKINKYDKFNGMIKLNEHYLLINFKNHDNSNRFNIYQI